MKTCLVLLAIFVAYSYAQICSNPAKTGKCWVNNNPAVFNCTDEYCCEGSTDVVPNGTHLACVGSGTDYTCCFVSDNPEDTTTTESTTGTCSDQASDCAQNVNLCDNSQYYSLMTQQCAKTCNRCGCKDLASNCEQNKVYCNNSRYYDLMTQDCPVTCQRCP